MKLGTIFTPVYGGKILVFLDRKVPPRAGDWLLVS